MFPKLVERDQKETEAGIRSFYKLVDYIENGRAAAAEAHWRLHVTNTNKFWTTLIGDKTFFTTFSD